MNTLDETRRGMTLHTTDTRVRVSPHVSLHEKAKSRKSRRQWNVACFTTTAFLLRTEKLLILILCGRKACHKRNVWKRKTNMLLIFIYFYFYRFCTSIFTCNMQFSYYISCVILFMLQAGSQWSPIIAVPEMLESTDESARWCALEFRHFCSRNHWELTRWRTLKWVNYFTYKL